MLLYCWMNQIWFHKNDKCKLQHNKLFFSQKDAEPLFHLKEEEERDGWRLISLG